jgi:tetratricopeptide (TPR) repeat protein
MRQVAPNCAMGRKWLTAFIGAHQLGVATVWVGMITFAILVGCLLVQQSDWIAAGNRALDKGSPEEAAADFAQGLDARLRVGASVQDLLHLRITLATAYMEAGEYRKMEAVLQQAQQTAWQLTDGISRAELLNAWSALHLKLGQLAAAEAELQQARQTLIGTTEAGDLLPTVWHNLAAVKMRTGRYQEALRHEQEAMRQLEKTLDPEHPTLIRGWASLASVQYMLGLPQEAKTSLERAIASAEKLSANALLADLLDSDAVVLDTLKLKKEARLARARAKKIRGKVAPAVQPTWSVREALRSESGVTLVSK